MIRIEYKTFLCRCGKDLIAPKDPYYDSEHIHTVDIKCPSCGEIHFYNFRRDEFVKVA